MPKGTINKFEVIGRLGKDPKILNTANCKKFAAFSVATNGDYKTKTGEKIEHTDWHQFLAFGRLADFVEKYLVTGKKIYVQAIVQVTVEETEHGKRSVATNIVRHIEMLDRLEPGHETGEEVTAYDEEEVNPDFSDEQDYSV